MAQLPADRTKLAQAQGNMTPTFTASSQKLKDALTEAYDTIDTLNQKVNDHGAAPTLPHADKSVTRAKLADKAVGATQLDDAAVGQSHHQDNGIPSRAIGDNVILQRHMSDQSIATEKFIDESVTLMKMSAEAKDSANHTYSGLVPGALTVKTAIDNQNTRIDNILANSTTLTEVVDARYSAKDGVTYSALKNRLDSNDNKIADLNKARQGSIPFGKITMPAGFAPLPCNFTRKHDGKIVHDFNFNQYKTGTVLYCDSTVGNDTTGTGAVGTPYKTINKAVQVAIAGADPSYLIKCKTVRFDRSYTPSERTVTGKTIAIVPDNAENKVVMTNHEKGLTWTADGASTWKATRSSVYSVFDLRYVDEFGCPISFENKTTLAECQASSATWYTDNVTVWVHTTDGLAPDDTNHCVGVSNPYFEITLLQGAKFYVENCWMIYGRGGQIMRIFGDETGATVTGEFVANNCIFAGGDLRTTKVNETHALSILGVKNTYLFNCIAAYGGEDGFNYHYQYVPNDQRRNCLALEYNCVSYRHGKFSTSNTSNATTCHEGACILRIGSIGYETKGPILADVNGCLSVCVDCHMRDSLTTLQNQKNAYEFNNNGATNGKAILINCDGGGEGTYSVNSDDGLDITLQSFRGFNFPAGFTATIQS